MNGAATNPDANVVAYAGTQLKKGLEIAKKLDAKNFVVILSVYEAFKQHLKLFFFCSFGAVAKAFTPF